MDRNEAAQLVTLAFAVGIAGVFLAAGIGSPSAQQGSDQRPSWGRGPGMGGPHGWGPRGDFWQPGWMHRRDWRPRNMPADMRARMQRHWTYMHDDIPSAYVGAVSPLKSTADVVAKGGEVYAKNCASCHGKVGLGDGAAGKSLTPSPSLLAYMIQRPMAVDEYLLWTISEGGAEFKTAMPAFKSTLKRNEIWQVIAYMRAGFPEPSAGGKSKAN